MEPEYVFGVVATLLFIFGWALIFTKAGYSGWLSLLLMIPLVNLIVLLIFVFGEWPVQRELQDLRVRCGLGNEDDACAMMNEAVNLEIEEKFDEAIRQYKEVIVRFRDTPMAKDAERSMAALQAKLTGSGSPGTEGQGPVASGS